MDHCKDSENVTMHSILCVKLEPFDEDEDCTQNLDPLEPDSNGTQMELFQDFKTEIESDCSNQAMTELIQEDILKNDPGDTGAKIEEVNIKTEYIDNEASTLDDVRDSHGIIEDGTTVYNQFAEHSSKHTDHGRVEKQKEAETNTTRYKLSHSCEAQRYDVINEKSTNDGSSLNVTSPTNHGVDVLRIHKHSTCEEEASKQSSSLIAHSLPRPSYVCVVCDMKFKNSRNLAKHKVVHTAHNPHVCDVCKKGFTDASSLVKHKRTHTGQKPYVCDICKTGFSQTSHLVSHKRIHTGEKPYACDICKKSFVRSSDLVKHTRIHTGLRPYICDICKKGFSDSSTLATHKRTHTGQKPYICEFCEQGFRHISALVRHKRIHTGEKPYICEICKKGFTNSSNLVVHNRIHHNQKSRVKPV